MVIQVSLTSSNSSVCLPYIISFYYFAEFKTTECKVAYLKKENKQLRILKLL